MIEITTDAQVICLIYTKKKTVWKVRASPRSDVTPNQLLIAFPSLLDSLGQSESESYPLFFGTFIFVCKSFIDIKTAKPFMQRN